MQERDNRGFQVALAVIAAAAIGFLIALIAFGNDDNGSNVNATVSQTTTSGPTAGTTTQNGTTTTVTVTTPTDPLPTVAGCIDLWNEPGNNAARTFMANLAASQAVRVHVGVTAQTPPECLVTVISNDGTVATFPEGGGRTFPYNPTPGRTTVDQIPATQRTQNALEQPDGTLKPKTP
jgi:hypothetical protein